MKMEKRMLNDFAVFIISHNKPKNATYNTLINKCHYTGKWYIVIDDKDKCIKEYQDLYGKDKVKIFSKSKIEKRLDMMDNFTFDKVIIYARNACFDIAKELGITYFMELDDDYDSFRYRFPQKPSCPVTNMNTIMKLYLNYYKNNPQIRMLAFCQGADMCSITTGKVLRKCMNSMICSVNRPVEFNGRINEDVNTYTRCNQLGILTLTLPSIQLNQAPTQTTGGMSETYKLNGTYVKSFYSVIQCPSFVKISTFTKGFRMSKFRIHHKIDTKYGYAKILSDKYKKKE